MILPICWSLISREKVKAIPSLSIARSVVRMNLDDYLSAGLQYKVKLKTRSKGVLAVISNN